MHVYIIYDMHLINIDIYIYTCNTCAVIDVFGDLNKCPVHCHFRLPRHKKHIIPKKWPSKKRVAQQ